MSTQRHPFAMIASMAVAASWSTALGALEGCAPPAESTGDPTPITSSTQCLDRASSQITAVPAGECHTEFDRTPSGANHTFDMRGTIWDANPPKRPITIRYLDGACVVGPKLVGLQSRDLTWEEMKALWDGDGVPVPVPPRRPRDRDPRRRLDEQHDGCLRAAAIFGYAAG